MAQSDGGGSSPKQAPPMTLDEFAAQQYAAENAYSTGPGYDQQYAWGGAASGVAPAPQSTMPTYEETQQYINDPANTYTPPVYTEYPSGGAIAANPTLTPPGSTVYGDYSYSPPVYKNEYSKPNRREAMPPVMPFPTDRRGHEFPTNPANAPSIGDQRNPWSPESRADAGFYVEGDITRPLYPESYWPGFIKTWMYYDHVKRRLEAQFGRPINSEDANAYARTLKYYFPDFFGKI